MKDAFYGMICVPIDDTLAVGIAKFENIFRNTENKLSFSARKKNPFIFGVFKSTRHQKALL